MRFKRVARFFKRFKFLINPVAIWLLIKSLSAKGRGKETQLAAVFSAVGLALGIATLVLAMAVMSGFERTLASSIVDMSGHLLLIKRGKEIERPQRFAQKINELVPEITRTIAFSRVEAISAASGKVQGVLLQGISMNGFESFQQKLGKRILKGQLNLSQAVRNSDQIPVVVGKDLADYFGLEVGQSFVVVLPKTDALNPQRFERKLARLEVTGIIDMGKHQFNTRYILLDLKRLQQFAELGDKYHGLLIYLNQANESQNIRVRLEQELGSDYWVMDWQSDPLFKAIPNEKLVIFFVLLIIVIVAAFNVSSSLYIAVVQKYRSIAVLKTLGAGTSLIRQWFASMGLVLGLVGIVGGFLLGIAFAYAFEEAQRVFTLLNPEVYKIGMIEVEFRFWDLFFVFAAALFICLLSSLSPAYKGASLNPVEGLRYE